MKNQYGMTPLLVIVLAASVFLSMGIGYYVLTNVTKKPSVADYESCIQQKDALIIETYPEQCVYNGQKFTNPAQANPTR